MSRRPLRVGMVCPYSFDTFGGVQHHVQGLADALRRAGCRVDVLAPGDPDLPRGRHVTVVGGGAALPFNGSVAPVRIGARRQVRAWLDAGRFDVVHVHEPAAPSTSFTAVRALLDSEVPVVATHHIAQDRALTLRMAAPTVLRAVLARVDAHIVVSEEARRTLLRYHRVDAVPVPNGVDAAALDPGDRALPLEDRRDLLFVGRPDEPRKGFDVLLAALPTVLERRPGARLVVVGGDHLPRDLPRDLARRLEPFRDRIELTGRLSEREKANRFAAARVLVAPNTTGESFGIVLAEALAAGVPVVASDLAAFRAVLGDGERGVLVPPGDADGLADAVLALLGDASRSRRLAEAGRVTAHSTFDWSAVAPRVLRVYGETAARRGHRDDDLLGWSQAPSGT
jgi:phosphatidylinositol alpha-mannosyltransferase